MGVNADYAGLRMIMRNMAPFLDQAFDNAAKQFGESKYNLHMIVGFKNVCEKDDHKNNKHTHVFKVEKGQKHPCAYEDHDNHVMVIKSFVNKDNVAYFGQDPNFKPDDHPVRIEDIFPIAKEFLFDMAKRWDISPFYVLMYIRLVYSEDPNKKDSVELKIKEKKSVLSKWPLREFIPTESVSSTQIEK